MKKNNRKFSRLNKKITRNFKKPIRVASDKDELLNKQESLANYFNWDVLEVYVTNDCKDYTEFETPDGPVRVMEYSQAIDFISQLAEDYLDEYGMDAFNERTQTHMVNYCVENEYDFEIYTKDELEEEAGELEMEDSRYGYANALIDSCVKWGIIDNNELDDNGDYDGDKDLIDEYVCYSFDTIDNYSAWYFGKFWGDDSLLELVNWDMNELACYLLENEDFGNLESDDNYYYEFV